MIRIIRKSSFLGAILCIFMVLQFTGCGEDTDDSIEAELNASEPPTLPPESSMTVDLSTFDEDPARLAPASTFATYKNFSNAVGRVAGVSAGLLAAAATPAAVFGAAILHEPVPQGDNSWLWAYEVTVEYVTFTAALTGTKNGETIDWSMTVSADAPLYPVVDFLWYTGTSAGTNLSGSWQFYDIKTPTEQNPTVNIDWAASETQEELELTIENIDSRPDSEYSGDVLDYDLTSALSALSYSDASEGEVWEIIWNNETGEGSLKVPEYNDGQKACWSSKKQDVECN